MDTKYLQTPDRFEKPSIMTMALTIFAVGLIYSSFSTSGVSASSLLEGIPRLVRLGEQMFPPDISRLNDLLYLLWQTFMMALCGTVIGIVVSIPLAILSAKNLTPHPLIRQGVKSLVSFFRTVPDLIWALVFVITVGLGPIAGAMTIAVDTIGFLGKFFAETMEEQEKGSQDAIKTLGGNKLDIAFSSVIPNSMASFINDSLFALEKATRSSVILGLVGAGGIGIELKVAMDMFNYATATSIIFMVFILVVIVEQLSGWLRKKVISV